MFELELNGIESDRIELIEVESNRTEPAKAEKKETGASGNGRASGSGIASPRQGKKAPNRMLYEASRNEKRLQSILEQLQVEFAFHISLLLDFYWSNCLQSPPNKQTNKRK